ncbi:MAG: hypothetical protein V3T17_15970 [Pseudomonadales bacterium]
MRNKKDPPASEQTSADELLGQLESIKDLLEDANFADDLDIDIPILDDVVTGEHNRDNNSSLLDINRNFDEDDDGDKDSILTTELNLDNLDTNITIPSFKLSATLSNASPTLKTAADNPLDNVTLPDTEPTASTGVEADLSAHIDDNSPDYQREEPQEEQQDQSAQKPPPDHLPSPKIQAITANNFDIDLLIQEIVDEFIPVLEDQLRQRLSDCSPLVLQQLAEKHLQS